MINISGHNHSSTAGSSIQNKIDTFIQRLSSGQRINAAKDDVAGVQISTRLNAEIKGLEQASKNAANGQSLLDTIDTSYEQVANILLSMRELAVQAANGTYQQADREIMNVEIKQLEAQIVAIGLDTSWAGLNFVKNAGAPGHLMENTLFMGYHDVDGYTYSTTPSVTLQIGVNSGDTLNIAVSSFDLDPGMGLRSEVSLGYAFLLQHAFDFSPSPFPNSGKYALTNINTVTLAGYKIGAIDQALSMVTTRRGKFAATNNRLDNLIANLASVKSNLAMSKRRIEDADIAQATTKMAKFQILQQASVQMDVLSKKSSDSVRTLLGGDGFVYKKNFLY